MSLCLILYTIIFLIIVIAVHILVWRLSFPKKQLLALFLIFYLIPIILLIIFSILNFKADYLSLSDLTASALMYFVLAQAYVQTYSAVQAVAPSLQIIYALFKADKNGLNEDEIIKSFKYENLVQDRLGDLISDGFIYENNKKLYMTFKGKCLAGIFFYYRKIYGLEIGKG